MSNSNYADHDQYGTETEETVTVSKTSKREKGQAKHGAKSARRVQRKRRVNR